MLRMSSTMTKDMVHNPLTSMAKVPTPMPQTAKPAYALPNRGTLLPGPDTMSVVFEVSVSWPDRASGF